MTAAICYSKDNWSFALADSKILPSCRVFLDALRLDPTTDPFYITGQALVIDTFRALLITEYQDLYDQVEFYVSTPFEKPDLQVLYTGHGNGVQFVNASSYEYSNINSNILDIVCGFDHVLYDKKPC